MSKQSAALNFATHHAMPPEFGEKCGTVCLNDGYSLLALLCAGYSVKLIKNILKNHLKKAMSKTTGVKTQVFTCIVTNIKRKKNRLVHKIFGGLKQSNCQ